MTAPIADRPLKRRGPEKRLTSDMTSRTVRGVDDHLWREVGAEAKRQDRLVGDLLSEIIAQWLNRKRGA